MKYIKMFLALLVFVSFSSLCYGDTVTSPASKLHFKGATPDSVVNKANQTPALAPHSPSIFQDPMVNSMLGGYGNMIQGTTGGSYSAEEMRRQQMDYAKQQVNVGTPKEAE